MIIDEEISILIDTCMLLDRLSSFLSKDEQETRQKLYVLLEQAYIKKITRFIKS